MTAYCDTPKKAQVLTLSLWQKIASMPNQTVTKTAEAFKCDVLRTMGVPRLNECCPFCDYIFGALGQGCDGCPIKSLCDNEYVAWSDGIRLGQHNQELAKEFYDALVDLFAVETSI